MPHRLYGHVDAAENYSVGRWLADVRLALDEVRSAGRLPILVGGTGLYFKALTQGLSNVPATPADIRARVRDRMEAEGVAALHAELRAIDPEAARRIAPTDSQRIQRALEVCYSAGQPISQLQRATASPLAGTPLRYWILAPRQRAVLHERLARRFETMMAAGFLDEVAALRARGDLTARHPAMRAVGSAVGRNPISFVVPCHRVLRSDGNLGGYHWGLTRKRALLRHFGSVRRIAGASVSEIAGLPGFGPRIAETVAAALRDPDGAGSGGGTP